MNPRFIPTISALIIFLLLQFLKNNSEWAFWLSGGVLGLVLCSGFFIVWKRGNWTIRFFSILLPEIFFFGYFIFFFFIESDGLKTLLNGIVSVLFLIYTQQIATFWHNPSQYKVYSLEYTSGIVNVLGSFFVFVSSFELFIFLQTPLWILMVSIFFLTFLFSLQLFWTYKIEWSRGKIYLFFIPFLMTELFWVLHFLPTSFYTLGLFMTIQFYMMTHLSRWHLTSALERKVIRRYVAIAAGIVLIVGGSTPWF